MQLSIDNDLRAIGKDLVSVLKDMYETKLSQKDLIISRLMEENKQLQEKLKGV